MEDLKVGIIDKLESVCEINTDFKEQLECIEKREITKDNFGIFAIKDVEKWQILGSFDPISTFDMREKGDLAESPSTVWANLMYKKLMNDENDIATLYRIQPRVTPPEGGIIPVEIERSTEDHHAAVSLLAFKLKQNSYRGKNGIRCLYKTLSFLNHSCIPNALILMNDKGYAKLVAISPIIKDDEVTVSYAYLGNKKEDEKILKDVYGLDCQCGKCDQNVDVVFELFTTCATCGNSREKLLKCSKCHSIRYCDIDCQRKNWKYHKILCGLLDIRPFKQ